MCEVGHLRNPEQIRSLGGPIWEFKIGSGWRIGAFQDGNVWYLTHVFKKPGKKKLRKEIKRAKEIRDGHYAEESQ
jgi:hypothetical protein